MWIPATLRTVPPFAAAGSAWAGGKRFTTYETVECLPIIVVKKDGRRQIFDRNKVLKGMVRACEKRPVPLAKLEAASAEIEQVVQNSLEREVKSDYIGELVMERPEAPGRGELCALCFGLPAV